MMQEIGVNISGHRSKPIDEFIGHDLHVVITVCDHAKESCPVFPGHTVRLHRPFEDPAAVEGTEEHRKDAFRKIHDRIHGRIMVFLGEGRA